MHNSNKAVCLLSGGVDSTTALAIAHSMGFAIYALSFNYGQRNKFEIDCARAVAESYNVTQHRIMEIDLRIFGGSSLTSDIAITKGRSIMEIGLSGIPLTYVPCRNTIFLSYALTWAEVIESDDIFIGVNAIDYSGYPDCRPEYIGAFETMSNLATRRTVEGRHTMKINAPLVDDTKAQIIRKGLELGVDYSTTISCYDPSREGISCGQCDSCIIRQQAFLSVGVNDPLKYQQPIEQLP